MEYNQLLNAAIEASVKAGELIMDVYNNSDIDVRLKSDMSPVTRADIESSQIIHYSLNKTGFPVLTEEDNIPSYSVRKTWNTYWLVDPLDGTKEFIKRNGEFTINIALIVNHVPVLGVVFIPVRKSVYYAIKGEGCYKIEKLNSINIDFFSNNYKIYKTRTEVPVIISSRSHVSSETSGFINRFEKRYGTIKKIAVGSTIKLCYLAEGIADIYPRYGTTMEWDTAAGQVIAGESGIKLFFAKNKQLEYNKPELSNPSFVAFNPDYFEVMDFF